MAKQFDLQFLSFKYVKAKRTPGGYWNLRKIPRFRHLDQHEPSTSPRRTTLIRTKGSSRGIK